MKRKQNCNNETVKTKHRYSTYVLLTLLVLYALLAAVVAISPTPPQGSLQYYDNGSLNSSINMVYNNETGVLFINKTNTTQIILNGEILTSWSALNQTLAQVLSRGDSADGQNIQDLGDVTFKTGANGGTLRTGTSNADKFIIQAYDVNDGVYLDMLEVDAGNEPYIQIFTDYFRFEDVVDPTKIAKFNVSSISGGTMRIFNFPDKSGTLALTSDINNVTLQQVTDYGSVSTNGIEINNLTLNKDSSTLFYGYIDAPNVSNTTLSTSTSGGTIPAGNWYISITYADDDGYETEFSERLGPISTTGSTSTITINDLPVSADDSVTKRVIYMSTSSVFQTYQVEVNNNLDTSYTLTSYNTVIGNDPFRGRWASGGNGVGNTMGGKVKNAKGDILYSISQEGQIAMTGERAGFIFPQKNTPQFDPLPFYILQDTTIPRDDFGYASMFYDINDGNILKLGHFGRGSYTATPVEIHSNQPGVEFKMVLSRGDPNGWLQLIDGGTSTPNVDLVRYSNTLWSASSGVNTLLRMDGSTSQSGSSGYTLLDFDFDNSGFTGSGVEELIHMKTSGSTKFKVEANGDLTNAGNIDSSGYLVLGSNTNTGLSAGDINASNIYYDTLTAKSPTFLCEQDTMWCKITTPQYQQELYVKFDDNFNPQEIVFNDNTYSVQQFQQQICTINSKTQNTCLEIKKKWESLRDKKLCENQNGFFENDNCYKQVTNVVTYNQATITEEIPVYKKEFTTCQKLNEDLQVENFECETNTQEIEKYETVTKFKENCNWNNEIGYYCKNKEEIII